MYMHILSTIKCGWDAFFQEFKLSVIVEES